MVSHKSTDSVCTQINDQFNMPDCLSNHPIPVTRGQQILTCKCEQ